MSFIQEFKSFALKGNVMDLAVGVIIGGAFGKIVDSVVSDLIMPLVSKAFGGLDFSGYYLGLAGQASGLPLAEAKKLGAVFAYGSFITVAVNFIILAFIIFMMVRQINRMKKEAPRYVQLLPELPRLLHQALARRTEADAGTRELVDELKNSRGKGGKVNTRERVAAVKEEVKPSKKDRAAGKAPKASGGSVATPRSDAGTNRSRGIARNASTTGPSTTRLGRIWPSTMLERVSLAIIAVGSAARERAGKID